MVLQSIDELCTRVPDRCYVSAPSIAQRTAQHRPRRKHAQTATRAAKPCTALVNVPSDPANRREADFNTEEFLRTAASFMHQRSKIDTSAHYLYA